MSNINDLIRQIVDDEFKTEGAILCTVDSVDGILCDVTPVDGRSQILDVRLQAAEGAGLLYIPKVGSNVWVIMQNDVSGFICMFSELESIKFLDGSYEGLIKINDLVDRLNTIESDINDLKTAFSGWTVVPLDGGAALKSIAASWYGSPLTQTVKGDIENDKITHGTI